MTAKPKQRASTSNHDKAPICAAFVKSMRKALGEDQVKVLWVKEGDFELGAKSSSREDAPYSLSADPSTDERG